MKRILVALDGSPRAPVVMSAAVHLARLSGAKLVLYRAIGVPPEVPRELLDATDARLEDILTRNAHGDLAKISQDVDPQLIERITTAFATPWDGICRAAREADADLVVIGAHGYGGIDRLLGTTAAKVANHCDRNLLVVRGTW